METFFEANPGFKSSSISSWLLNFPFFFVENPMGSEEKAELQKYQMVGIVANVWWKKTRGFIYYYCVGEHFKVKADFHNYVLTPSLDDWRFLIWVLGKPWTKLSEIWTPYFASLRWSFGDFVARQHDNSAVDQRFVQKTSFLSFWGCI